MKWFKNLVRNFSKLLENPSNTFDDIADYEDSWSGIHIDRDTALTYDTVYRCVDYVSSQISLLPIYIYKHTDNGKVLDEQHPCYRLLRWKPSRYVTMDVWLSNCMVDVLLHGNHYSFIQRDEATYAPLELRRLDPTDTYPFVANGVLYYQTKKEDNTYETISYDKICHVRSMGDDLMGYSVLDLAAQSLGLALASERYAKLMFENGSAPQVVITHPLALDEPARLALKKEWMQMQGGLGNSFKPAIMDDGVTVSPFNWSPEASQLIESRKFSVRQCANWFGVPAWKCGDESRMAYNSLEADERAFMNSTLAKWLVRIENSLTEKLLTEKEKRDESHCILFDRNKLVSLDAKVLNEILTMQLTNGVINRNEYRAEIDRNPIEGGDVYNVAGNIGATPLDKPDEQSIPGSDPKLSATDNASVGGAA